MKRSAYRDLIKWKNDENRKPLLIQGARQVGKTWLVTEFAKNEYRDFVLLNFEKNPSLGKLFIGDKNPARLIENISLTIGKAIKSENTLIFFDEIQISPEALTSLKYFCEEAPEYHIIAAGSLLGVRVGKQSSFPVGKVEFLTLYPMTFEEFLFASGEKILAEKLSSIRKPEPFVEPVHAKYLELYKKYLYLGGMPEVIQDYLDHQDIKSVRKIQERILDAYQQDFSKYTNSTQAIKTSEVWHSIPSQLAKENKKFKYGDVRKNSRASTYAQTIDWLKNAGLIHLAYNVSTPKLPLSGYADHTRFKVYMHDTGLLSAMLKVSSSVIVKGNELFSQYNGAFIENAVAQELVAHGESDLYYWTSGYAAEVDFVIQEEDRILPLEVKSGLNRNLKSLRSYSKKYSPERIYRTSPRNLIQSDDFVNLPLYASALVGI